MSQDLNHRQRDIGIAFELQRSGALSRSELARRLGCTPAAVSKRLALLHTDEIVQPKGEGTRRRWVLVNRYQHRALGVADRMAWALGAQHLSFLDGTLLKEFFERSETTSSTPSWARGEFTQKLFHLAEPARSYMAHRDVLEAVMDALYQERTLSFRYASASGGEQHLRDVEPLTLVAYRRALYLMGRHGEETRPWAVDRIHDPVSADRFDYPTDWSPHHHCRPWFGIHPTGGIGEVVLDFSAQVAPYVRARNWHHTAKLSVRPCGGVRLTMRTGGPELQRFIREWGPNCVVVRPKTLRESVAADLQAALAHYRPSNTDSP